MTRNGMFSLAVESQLINRAVGCMLMRLIEGWGIDLKPGFVPYTLPASGPLRYEEDIERASILLLAVLFTGCAT